MLQPLVIPTGRATAARYLLVTLRLPASFAKGTRSPARFAPFYRLGMAPRFTAHPFAGRGSGTLPTFSPWGDQDDLSCRRDEIGKGDEVVLIVARPGVERPAAGDQPEGGMADEAVDQFGGERVLGEPSDPRHSKYRRAAVLSGDGDLVTGLQAVQPVEHPRPVPVDMTNDDRSTQLTGRRHSCVPTGGEAARRNLQGLVLLQSEGHQIRVHADCGDLQTHRHRPRQMRRRDNPWYGHHRPRRRGRRCHRFRRRDRRCHCYNGFARTASRPDGDRGQQRPNRRHHRRAGPTWTKVLDVVPHSAAVPQVRRRRVRVATTAAPPTPANTSAAASRPRRLEPPPLVLPSPVAGAPTGTTPAAAGMAAAEATDTAVPAELVAVTVNV